MSLFDRLTGKATLDRFAADLIRAIRAAGCTDELQYKSGQITQIRDGKPAGVMNLGNMFHSYASSSRKERPELLQRFARVIKMAGRRPPEEYDLAKPDLRTRIWTRSTVEFEHRRGAIGKGREIELVAVPVGEHLFAALAYDWPESVSSVPPDLLETWGVTPYEALEDAAANLEAATEGYAAIGDSLYAFTSGDSYDASRLTLTAWIAALEVRGRHVAMVPNRDALFVTGSDDEEGLGMMAKLAEQAQGEGYPLIGVPLVLDDGDWVEWKPPADHPHHQAFRELRLNWIGPVYAEQKELLDATLEKTGDDVFISSFSALETEAGLFSYCVWGEEVRSLLPVTDKVALIRQEGAEPIGLADWGRVMEVAAHLLEETEHYPKRYRTLGFPDEEVIRALDLGSL